MTSRTPKTPGASQDTPVIPADPVDLAADIATDLDTNYPELVKNLNARINELEAENAQLRARLSTADTDADTAPTPPIGGMELTASGWVIK